MPVKSPIQNAVRILPNSARAEHALDRPTAPSNSILANYSVVAANVCFQGVRSTGQCNTACSLSAGVWKPKVFRGR